VLPASPIMISLPGVTQVLGPSFQLQVSVTRYQFVPVGGVGNVNVTLPDHPLKAMYIELVSPKEEPLIV
jgi:hypothetical protein